MCGGTPKDDRKRAWDNERAWREDWQRLLADPAFRELLRRKPDELDEDDDLRVRSTLAAALAAGNRVEDVAVAAGLTVDRVRAITEAH